MNGHQVTRCREKECICDDNDDDDDVDNDGPYYCRCRNAGNNPSEHQAMI